MAPCVRPPPESWTPLVSTGSLATIRKPETFKNRASFPLTCRLNTSLAGRAGQPREWPPDTQETPPAKSLFLNPEHLLESVRPSSLHRYLLLDGFQPVSGIGSGSVFGNRTSSHHLCNHPRFIPGVQAYLQISFACHLCLNCRAVPIHSQGSG